MKTLRRFLLASTLACLSVCGLPTSVRAEECSWHFDRVLICPDESGSLDAREYEAVVEALVNVLPNLLVAVDATEFSLLPWARSLDCWRSPRSVTIPVAPPVGSGAPSLGEAERLFRVAKLRAEAKAHATQQAQATLVRSNHHQLVAQAAGPLLDELGRSRRRDAPCTAIAELLERCSAERRGTLIVLLTDGREVPCADSSPSSRAVLLEGATTLVVLLPSQDDDRNAPSFEERVRGMQARAPWLRFVPSFRVTDKRLDWLFDALASQPDGPSSVSATAATEGVN